MTNEVLDNLKIMNSKEEFARGCTCASRNYIILKNYNTSHWTSTPRTGLLLTTDGRGRPSAGRVARVSPVCSMSLLFSLSNIDGNINFASRHDASKSHFPISSARRDQRGCNHQSSSFSSCLLTRAHYYCLTVLMRGGWR